MSNPSNDASSGKDRGVLTGVLLVLLASAMLPFMDSLAKILGQHGYPSSQIAWGRYFFNFVLFLPIVLGRYGLKGLKPDNPGMLVVRGIFPAIAAMLYFYSLNYLAFADAAALFFIAPFLIVALSVPILREKVGIRRWLAVGVGFLGTLIIVRPGFGLIHWAAFFALGGAFGFAMYAVLTRKVAGGAPATVATCYMAGTSALLLIVLAPFQWISFDTFGIGLMAGMGVIGALAQYALTVAYEKAEAGLLAPLHYFELVFAVGISINIFGEYPSSTSWIGMGFIVAAGLYVAWRESRIKKHAPAAAIVAENQP